MGYQIVYLIQQYELKEQAERVLLSKLNDDLFEKIDAATPGLVWEEEGKEFHLKGQLYDVAKSTTRNGVKILYCINDKNEDLLIENFLKDFKTAKDNSSDKNTSHSLKLISLQGFITDAIQFVTVPICMAMAATNYSLYSIGFTKNNIIEVITPPPNKMYI